MIYFLSFLVVSLQAVDNEGKECWRQCGTKSGDCAYCGKDGACCRKGYDGQLVPECGGMGSPYAHVCTKRQNPDDAVKKNEGCKKCVNIDGWPCFNPQDDLSEDDNLPFESEAYPCVAANHKTRKCAEGLVDCRTHIDETDYTPYSCTGQRHKQYKLFGVHPDTADIDGPRVTRDSTPAGVRDWDRFLFSTFIEGKKVPTNMRLVIKWEDQGWGNRKGLIRICYKGRTHTIVPVYASHRMKVYTVEVGDGVFYDWTQNALGKNSFDEGQLHFSYLVGGGGGHTLTIVNMKVSFGYDAVPQPFLYGVCQEEERYNSLVLGRSCQQFCWGIGKQCKKSEKMADVIEYCVAEKKQQRGWGCKSADEGLLICTCEPSEIPIPTPRPTLDPENEKVYTREWPYGSLLGKQGVENVFKSDLIKVTGESTAHITVEGMGHLDRQDPDDDSLPYDYLKVAISGKDVKTKTVVEVDGWEWMGDYEYHFEEEDEIQFLIYSHVSTSDELYSVDLRVDHAVKLKGEGGDSGEGKDDDKLCGYLAKKISWENQAIVKKASSNKKVKLTDCDCKDICDSTTAKAWSFQIKKGKCMCYGPKDKKEPLVIKKIGGDGKKASYDTAKVIISHKKKGEL